MKNIVLTYFFVLSISSLFSQVKHQPYFYNILLAQKSVSVQNNYDSAAYYYTKAFNTNSYKYAKDLYDAAVVFTKIGKDSIGMQYILEAYRKGLAKKYKLKKNKFWHLIKDSIPACVATAQKRRNKRYEYIVDSLNKQDQRVRTNKYFKAKDIVIKYLKDTAFNKNDVIYKNAKKLLSEWQHTDSSNFFTLRKYIRKYGFPYEGNMLKKYIEDAFIILFHFDYDKTAQTTFEIIDSALVNGYITPQYYALIVDRRMAFNLGRFPYYFQIPVGLNRLSSKEIKKINKRRNNIGLKDIDMSKIKFKNDKMKIKN